MKYICFALLFIFSCSASKKNKNKMPFEIIKATSQNVAGGAPGAGTATEYKFEIKKITEDVIEFKQLWVGEKESIPTRLKRKSRADNYANYKAEDIMNVVATKRNLSGMLKQRLEKNGVKRAMGEAAPYKFEGDALIEYTRNEETHYFEIKEIKELDSIALP